MELQSDAKTQPYYEKTPKNISNYIVNMLGHIRSGCNVAWHMGRASCNGNITCPFIDRYMDV